MDDRLKNQSIYIAALMVVVLLALRTSARTESSYQGTSLSSLERHAARIDAELGQLAHYSLRSGIGNIGYRSAWHIDNEPQEWVQIQLNRDYLIDEIVLVPTIWRDTEKGFQSDCFPAAFRIVLGTEDDPKGQIVAEYHDTSNVLPRIAPLVIPIQKVAASWVRVEATRLCARAFDGRYALQLAEVLVFSGSEDVALRCPVEASSIGRSNNGAWGLPFLVDGFMPYLMDSAQGNQSRAFVSRRDEKPTLILDLGQPYRLSRIHLHAVDQGDTVPQAYAGDLGIPYHLIIEGANQEDFSDRRRLLEYQRESIHDTGPIMMWRIPEQICRYVRLYETASGHSPYLPSGQSRIGFAEIEFFSMGKNVALGKSVTRQEDPDHASPKRLEALTDGNNHYGKILPIRTWLNELALRHNLETERPLVAAELSRRYDRQKDNLRRMGWLAVLLSAGIAFTILMDRRIRMKYVARIKKRFAADLHDELGANVHSIGVLTEIAQNADSPEELDMLHERIWGLTQRTGTAIRHCTNMLEADDLYFGLVEDMRRAAERITPSFKHDIEIEGETYLNHLKPRTHIDLFLFYKECLVNICRHSGATELRTRLVANATGLRLVICDNGVGMPSSLAGKIPPSLQRRAHFLRAKISIDRPDTGGTRISLRLSTRRWWRHTRKGTQ